MVKSFCLRIEKCWIWAVDGGFLAVGGVAVDPPR